MQSLICIYKVVGAIVMIHIVMVGIGMINRICIFFKTTPFRVLLTS